MGESQREGTKVRSREVEEFVETSAVDGKYLSFWTDGQRFGVPIADVVQIVGMQDITAIPDSDVYVKGIINLRGNVIPIIDVRMRIGKSEREYDEKTCIIVTSMNKSLMGFIVDAVDEVSTIEEEDVSLPPKTNSERASTFITGIAKVDGNIVLLINTKKLLGEEEIGTLSQLAV